MEQEGGIMDTKNRWMDVNNMEGQRVRGKDECNKGIEG